MGTVSIILGGAVGGVVGHYGVTLYSKYKNMIIIAQAKKRIQDQTNKDGKPLEFIISGKKYDLANEIKKADTIKPKSFMETLKDLVRFWKK